MTKKSPGSEAVLRYLSDAGRRHNLTLILITAAAVFFLSAYLAPIHNSRLLLAVLGGSCAGLLYYPLQARSRKDRKMQTSEAKGA